ncbi:MAG: DPP IV N-terminal domain-containing protein [Planctomycetota bacterium]
MHRALTLLIPLLPPSHGALAAQRGGIPAPQERLELAQILDKTAAPRPKLPAVQWVARSDQLSRAHGDGDARTVATRGIDEVTWRPRFTVPELRAALEVGGAELTNDEQAVAWQWRDDHAVRIDRGDGVWHWRVGEAAATRVLTAPKNTTTSALAPDDQTGAFVADHDLWIARADGRTKRVTWDGDTDLVYGGAAHRAEFGIDRGLWWDATGRRLAFSREDQRPNQPYPYADLTADAPTAVAGRYPMAGQPHARVSIGIWDGRDDSMRYLAHDPDVDQYWTNVTFGPDGSKIYVTLVTRGQDHCELVRFDAATGAREATLLREHDAEWIEPESGPRFVPRADGATATAPFLWFSSRDGYRHLYLHDADGTRRRQVTDGNFDVRELLAFEGTGDAARALVTASGPNPLEMHCWSVPLSADGTMTRLTAGRGWHEPAVSGDGRWLLDRHSSLVLPGALDLIETRGGQSLRLATAEDPLAKFRVGERRLFRTKASDGTPLHGLLFLPPEPVPAQRYPVLQYVYGGPHSQLVRDAWLGSARLWLPFMASRGYVVLVLDNRGTANRGVEFGQAVFRRLGTLEVEDQLRGLDHVLREVPYADPSRVGVHGWSYGGFMTLSLMTRSNGRYTCGVSGAPVTDWAQYETGYTERYMDTPLENPEGFARASVVARAKDLAGRLLLVHGTDDKTVMLSHSIRFLDACVDADKLVQFMAYPMQQHGLRGQDRAHFYRLMTRFFDEQLRYQRSN